MKFDGRRFLRAGAILVLGAAAAPGPRSLAATKEPPKAAPDAAWTFIHPEAPKSRIVAFPEQFPLGEIFVRPWDNPDWNAWRSIGKAQGSVKIQAGDALRLDLYPQAARALDALLQVGADDIHAINAGRAALPDSQLQYLSHLTGLKVLNLRRTPVTDAGLEHLKPLERLETLYLDGCAIGDAGLAHLAGLGKLAHLGLARKRGPVSGDAPPRITDAGIAHLAGLHELQFLDLSGSAATDAGLDALSGLGALYHLNLGATAIGDEGLKKIARLPRIHFLSVQGTSVTDAGVAALEASPHLTDLDLSMTHVGPGCLRVLATIPNLSTLNLAFTQPLGEEGGRTLATMRTLKNLQIGDAQLEKEKVEALGAARPDLKIRVVALPGR